MAFKSSPLNPEEVDEVIADAEKLRLLKKACYGNAAQLVINHSEKYTYIEGYVVAWIIPIRHALVVDKKGRVIDLTLQDKQKTREEVDHELNNIGKCPSLDRESNIFGRLPDGWEYYGVPFKRRYLAERAVKTKRYGSLIDDWEHGFPLLTMPSDKVKEEALA